MRGLQYNGSGYYDPTAYQAIINAEKGQKGKTMEVYRGDIFYVKKVGSITGSEQESGRPAVIVSNDTGNQHSPVVEVVYLTTQDKPPMPTHCKVICKQKSTALCEQVYTVSKDRLADYVKTCSDAEMREIDRCLMVSLGLKEEPDAFEDAAHEMHKEMQALIDDLTMKLEGAERSLDEEKDSYNKLLSEIEAHRPMLSRSPEEVKEALEMLDSLKTCKPIIASPEEVEWIDKEKIQMKTERDLYKQLYEQAFERLVAR